ncbi:uncharacterized protein [Dysidea avara]|uniref:uncharacterized protein isoform X2 n=1 Tax=Dysidea avara TaxID=196820 RepID=UPI003329883E
MQMLLLLLLLATLVSFAKCKVPMYDPQKKVYDCTNLGINHVCDITLVAEAFTTMTYYEGIDEYSEYEGFRATFDANGNIVPLLDEVDTSNVHLQPIQADGYFRPILTINGQMPSPTIIVIKNQTLNVTVYNRLRGVEGITIHWHGMFQNGTQEADGAPYITQTPIGYLDSFTYTFEASPAGTHWYHAHTSAHRTDGLYGALIVRDIEFFFPGLYDTDIASQHTLILMDWQREPSVNLFYTIGASLEYLQETEEYGQQYFTVYNATVGPDGTEVGPIPFWSGIINDKGRHFNQLGEPNIPGTSLNYFTVQRHSRNRFRIIGAQALYSFRFSIEGHKLTVIASDGDPIKPIENVNYVIVHTGERYDVVVTADNTEQKDFWIWAETLEDEDLNNNEIYHNPINTHRAEAVLHYAENPPMDIEEITQTWECTPSSKCKAVNCPFSQYKNIMDCVNVDEFESHPDIPVPEAIYSPTVTGLFYTFGETGTEVSFVDGLSFRLPTNPPLTEFESFQNSNEMCPRRGCNGQNCTCTHVIDLSNVQMGSVVEIVIVNRILDGTDSDGASHPVHLHGHHFYAVKTGYPEYNTTTGEFVKANDDIRCVASKSAQCQNHFSTIEGNDGLIQELVWSNDDVDIEARQFARKDTILVPFGGYSVIRFMADNPGWWLFHCHIQTHLLKGMGAVIRLLQVTDFCEVDKISGNVQYHRRKKTATLTFSVAGRSAATTIECRLDNESFRTCTSPLTFSDIRRGRHRVTVKATCPNDGDTEILQLRFRAHR